MGSGPEGSAHQAVEPARQYQTVGNGLDFASFFGEVNHGLLMARVSGKVTDIRMRKLIRACLNYGLMTGGLMETKEQGTPQDGPLSPLM